MLQRDWDWGPLGAKVSIDVPDRETVLKSTGIIESGDGDLMDIVDAQMQMKVRIYILEPYSGSQRLPNSCNLRLFPAEAREIAQWLLDATADLV